MYDSISDFLKDFCESDEDIDKFIISAIASTEPLTTPASKGATADDYWFSGVTEDDIINLRHQMRTATRESLKEWCGVFDEMADNGCVCVVGNNDALSECEDLTVYDI